MRHIDFVQLHGLRLLDDDGGTVGCVDCSVFNSCWDWTFMFWLFWFVCWCWLLNVVWARAAEYGLSKLLFKLTNGLNKIWQKFEKKVKTRIFFYWFCWEKKI